MLDGIQEAEMARGQGRGWEVVKFSHSLTPFAALKIP